MHPPGLQVQIYLRLRVSLTFDELLILEVDRFMPLPYG